jgi:hypothetical protein
MIYGGFTWPLNAVLCNAGFQAVAADTATGITTGITDPQTALQAATQAVCAKLKSDYGSNIRIYIVKYRKQTGYKNRISGAVANFDYTYLNSCAGPGDSSGSTSAPYTYDVTSEADLKSALSAIAEDLKTFAGHKKAQNVLK